MRYLLALVLWALSLVPAQAQDTVIRIWGNPALLGVAEQWAAGFAAQYPGVRFEFMMMGSDSAIHGLVSGAADIALIGRENDVVDDNGFSRPKEYAATRIEIATGSVTTPGKSDAIAILTHADNPLRSLTLDQLSRMLDCGDQRRPIATWGMLGLGGEWADAPIRVHAYDFSTRTGIWLQDRVTSKDRRMCWDRIVEYADQRRLDGTVAQAADRAGDGARSDRFALAIANAAQADDTLKLIPLSDGGPALLPTRATVESRAYPLTRRAYAFFDRAPGRELAPHLRDFLRFVLSPEGQALLEADAGYLPLSRDTAQTQLTILESTL